MIYKAIREAVETVPGLEGQVYPAGVVTDSFDGPFAVYSCTAREPFRVMGGRIHHYTDTVEMDFLAESYDDACALYEAAETSLLALIRQRAYGVYVFDVTCLSAQGDGLVQGLELMRRCMTIQISWRNV